MTQPGLEGESVGPALGARIRAHRQLRRMSLRSLAALSGTSPSFISQLERGQTGVSVANLVQIADALGVSLGAFFGDTAHVTPAVMRRQDRPTLATGNGVRKTLITRRPADAVEVYAAELEVGASTGGDTYTHGDSHEVFMVLTGEVELTLGPDRVTMGAGDSVEYRTSVPHGVANTGTVLAEMLWIISPPTASVTGSHAGALVPVPSVATEAAGPDTPRVESRHSGWDALGHGAGTRRRSDIACWQGMLPHLLDRLTKEAR